MPDKFWNGLEAVVWITLFLVLTFLALGGTGCATVPTRGSTPAVLAPVATQEGVTVQFVGVMPKPEGLYVCGFLPGTTEFVLSCVDYALFMDNLVKNQAPSAGR